MNHEKESTQAQRIFRRCHHDRSFLPGEKLVWDAAQIKVMKSEKANGFVDPAYRNGYWG